jgi:hypothetical protein
MRLYVSGSPLGAWFLFFGDSIFLLVSYTVITIIIMRLYVSGSHFGCVQRTLSTIRVQILYRERILHVPFAPYGRVQDSFFFHQQLFFHQQHSVK